VDLVCEAVSLGDDGSVLKIPDAMKNGVVNKAKRNLRKAFDFMMFTTKTVCYHQEMKVPKPYVD